MKKRINFILLMLLCTLTLGAEEVTLETASGNLAGTLVVPKTDELCPVVLLIAGSGPTDRNGNTAIGQMKNNSLRMIAEALEEAGIASLRYDKRGIGASKSAGKDESFLRFEDFVADAQAWVDLLAADKRFSQVIVAGHSEGSLIGMLTAQGRKAVRAFISIAGAGRPAYDIIEEQMAKQPENIRKEVAEINASLRKGEPVSPVPPYLYALFRPQIQPYIISWYRYNPQIVAMTLRCPMLVVQGTKDIQVPASEVQALTALAPGAMKCIIEGMNHVLKPCHSMEMEVQKAVYADPELPLHEELMPAIIGFIGETMKRIE